MGTLIHARFCASDGFGSEISPGNTTVEIYDIEKNSWVNLTLNSKNFIGNGIILIDLDDGLVDKEGTICLIKTTVSNVTNKQQSILIPPLNSTNRSIGMAGKTLYIGGIEINGIVDISAHNPQGGVLNVKNTSTNKSAYDTDLATSVDAKAILQAIPNKDYLNDELISKMAKATTSQEIVKLLGELMDSISKNPSNNISPNQPSSQTPTIIEPIKIGVNNIQNWAFNIPFRPNKDALDTRVEIRSGLPHNNLIISWSVEFGLTMFNKRYVPEQSPIINASGGQIVLRDDLIMVILSKQVAQRCSTFEDDMVLIVREVFKNAVEKTKEVGTISIKRKI